MGGVGALAWGIGSTEGEHVLATQTLPQVKPKTMRVNFEGELGPGVYPKDMILHLIGKIRSEEHTSELQSLMRISYAVFCLKKKTTKKKPSNKNNCQIQRHII